MARLIVHNIKNMCNIFDGTFKRWDKRKILGCIYVIVSSQQELYFVTVCCVPPNKAILWLATPSQDCWPMVAFIHRDRADNKIKGF